MDGVLIRQAHIEPVRIAFVHFCLCGFVVDFFQHRFVQQVQELLFRQPAECAAGEHQSVHIRGDMNIPLIFLRMKANSLDSDKKYVIYCDTGRRSSAASFLLNEKDIETYVLRDGVDTADQADTIES